MRPERTATSPPLSGLLAAAMALAASPVVGAQEPQPLTGFSEIVDVRVVNVEVVVTDSRGERVGGLGVGDFELIVDGEETPIDFFSEVRDGAVRTPPGSAPTAGAPGVRDDGTLRTSYLVFVDDFFSIGQDRNRVLERLVEQLGALGPGDRVALVAFDGNELTLLSGWTRDPAEVRAAVEAAKRRHAYGSQRLTELRQNDAERRDRADLQLLQIERIQAAGGDPPEQPFFATKLSPVERYYAERLTRQVERSVLAATAALRSFAAPPGRKVMLLLSGGWPYSPAEYTVSDFRADVEDTVGAALDVTIAGRDPLLRPLTDTANLLGYTLYPIDVPGENREIGTDASENLSDFERYAPNADAGGTAQPRELHAHRTLLRLAEETGGRAWINAQRDHALEQTIADTRTFYWLGFTPKRQEDDRRHRIEVRVRRPGLEVRARSGFVDLSRGAEVTMMVESALLFGDPPSAKPLGLRFGKPRRAGLGKMSVPLEVGIPITEVALVPQGGHWVNQLEIRTVVMNDDGSRSDTVLDQIPIDGTRPPQPGDVYYYETDLKLRRQPHRLVVAVYDPLSGAILSSSAEINPR